MQSWLELRSLRHEACRHQNGEPHVTLSACSPQTTSHSASPEDRAETCGTCRELKRGLWRLFPTLRSPRHPFCWVCVGDRSPSLPTRTKDVEKETNGGSDLHKAECAEAQRTGRINWVPLDGPAWFPGQVTAVPGSPGASRKRGPRSQPHHAVPLGDPAIKARALPPPRREGDLHNLKLKKISKYFNFDGNCFHG